MRDRLPSLSIVPACLHAVSCAGAVARGSCEEIGRVQTGQGFWLMDIETLFQAITRIMSSEGVSEGSVLMSK